MNFFLQKINGLKWRIKCYSYGIVYLRQADFIIPNTLKINRRKKNISFIDVEDGAFKYEFVETCLNDGYNLKALKKRIKKVNSIVDIGANQGLFTIAARQHFPKASITCYEPNKQLENNLSHNALALNAKVFYEAVTKEDCKVQLEFGETNLHTKALQAEEGNIAGTSFKEVINRAGGKIDILKMDCEGGEWEILEDEDDFKYILSITMEYHLWARPQISVSDLVKRLHMLNFKILTVNPITADFGLLTAIKNRG